MKLIKNFYEFDSLIYKVNTHRQVLLSHIIRKHLNFTNYEFFITEYLKIFLICLKMTQWNPGVLDFCFTASNKDFVFIYAKNNARIENLFWTPGFSEGFKIDNTANIGIPFNLNSLKITVVGSINMDTYLMFHSSTYRKTVITSTSSVYPGEKESIRLSVLPDWHRNTDWNVGSDLILTIFIVH